MDLYRKEFINAWRSSRSRMPIDVWTKAVGSKLPAFQHPEDIYAPIMLDVKIAGGINDPNGSVKLAVATTDEQWYSKFIQGIEEMTGKRGLTAVNYLGEPIEGLSAAQLSRVGEVDILDSQKQLVRLEKVVPPPMHMSTEKAPIIKEWWESHRDKLAKTIAQSLSKMSMSEIAASTMKGGPVQKKIEAYLCSSIISDDTRNWSQFIQTYGMDNVAKQADPDETCTFIAKGLLHSIRESLKANEDSIETFHTTAAIGSEAGLWKSNKGTKSQYQDAFTMYRDVVEDALHRPRIGTHMIDTILHGYQRVGVIASRLPQRVHATKSKVTSDIHPVGSYYSKIHYPAHGKLPGHVMDQYNQNKVRSTQYPGDAKVAFDIYNMLTGKAILPDSTPKMPPLVPIGDIADRPRMPPLVPIGDDVKLPDLDDFLPTRRMPPLVPIGNIADRPRMPPLIPIEGLVAPPRMPPLIPIETEAYPELGEPIWSMDNMPQLEDFL